MVCLASVQLTTLQRTDIRPVDPSLLGRQRCISLHIKNGPHIQPPAYSPMYEKRTPSSSSSNFPISPSAPEFFSFSTSSSSHSIRSSSNAGFLEDPISVNEGGQTLFLAFPTTALQHACECIQISLDHEPRLLDIGLIVSLSWLLYARDCVFIVSCSTGSMSKISSFKATCQCRGRGSIFRGVRGRSR